MEAVMRSYTPREIRSAVLLAVVVTAIAMLALLDPSCQRTSSPHAGPSRSLAPR
jgi:hypothetical protein